MNSRTAAFAIACALALGGCASYAPSVRSDGSYAGRYDDGYYAAPRDGYGDYYYDRPEIVYHDVYPGFGWGFGSFGYGYGYGYGYGGWGFDPWYRDPWYGHGWGHHGGWGHHPGPGHHHTPPPGGFTANGIHPIQVPIQIARPAVGTPPRRDDADGPRSSPRGRDNDGPSQGPRNTAREPMGRERPRR